MSFQQMKVGTRLGLGFGSVVLLLLLVALVAVIKMVNLGDSLHTLTEDTIPKSEHASEISRQATNIALAMRNMLLVQDKAAISAEQERLKNAREKINNAFEHLDKTIHLPRGIELLKNIQAARDAYRDGQNKFIQLVNEGRRDEAATLLMTEISKRQAAYVNAIDQLRAFQNERVTIVGKASEEDIADAKLLIIGLTLAAVLVAITVGYLITRKLLTQLGGEPDHAATIAGDIAMGNLNTPIQLQAGDSTSLMASMKAMQETLNRLVHEIQEVVHAASQAGDFSRRINIAGKQGFGKDIANGLNQLAEVTATGLHDVMRVSQALADGDLSQQISKDYPGVFGQTKTAVNGTVDSLNTLISEVQRMVEAAANRGDFSQRMALSDKKGYTKTLAETLNQLSDVTNAGLNDVKRLAAALAEGNLTQKIDHQYPGAFGEVALGMNITVDNLTGLITQIKTAVDSINVAAREISEGNQDLSSRTEEQASSLEETASSLEELTSTVKQNTSSAQDAAKMGVNASQTATEGGQVVGRSAETISEISVASRRIADIIGVIDGIAFQTNILALNAAVEAARAGEQGRGFAVVATEVRNLAHRSASAAKEIKGLINDSLSRIEAGVDQANEAGRAMGDVVSSVRNLTHIISEISSASLEQASGIEQINLAVTQMDEVTQQNAALVEQAAAAAENLQEQARELGDAVAVFRLSQDRHQELLPVAPSPVSQPIQQGKKTLAAATLPAPVTQNDDDWSEF